MISSKSATKTAKTMTPSQLGALYDKEDKTAERAGNAEERLMRAVSDVCRKTPALGAKADKIWELSSAKIEKLMNMTEKKVENVKTNRAQRVTELRIKSLETQIIIYQNGLVAVGKLK